jgi:uncharacterized membrane protein
MALHGVGTVALGGGIFLAAQIFNLQENWPSGILLWAIGALLSATILRDWVQGTLSALLIPAWIASEWAVRTQHYSGTEQILAQFLAMVTITYLSARRSPQDSPFRRALGWIGGIALLPVCGGLAVTGFEWYSGYYHRMPFSVHATSLLLVFVPSLATAYILRGRAAIWNLGYALWVFLVASLNSSNVFQNMSLYLLYMLASSGLVLWGVKERRRERINLGVAGFALTVIAFYFSTVMDKIGRSASLIAFGLLFLLGGWKLEQLRRKLVAHTREGDQP